MIDPDNLSKLLTTIFAAIAALSSLFNRKKLSKIDKQTNGSNRNFRG